MDSWMDSRVEGSVVERKRKLLPQNEERCCRCSYLCKDEGVSNYGKSHWRRMDVVEAIFGDDDAE